MSRQKSDKIIPVSKNINYATVIYDLHIKLKKSKNDKEKIKIYSEFSKNYFMSKALWDQRYKIQFCLDLYKEGIYHFNYNKRMEYIRDFTPKIYQGFKITPFTAFGLVDKNYAGVKKSLVNLSFSNYILQKCLMGHEKFCSSPLPKKLFDQVEKLERLYWKIRGVEDNLEKWIQTFFTAAKTYINLVMPKVSLIFQQNKIYV